MLSASDNFVANVFHQNAAPNDAMHGNPVGPYFNFDESNCFWRPSSGQLSCAITVYADAARLNRIGNGTLSSSNLIKHDDALNLVDGDILIQTNIAPHAFLPKPSELNHRDNRNFLSQSTSVHFRRQAVRLCLLWLYDLLYTHHSLLSCACTSHRSHTVQFNPLCAGVAHARYSHRQPLHADERH